MAFQDEAEGLRDRLHLGKVKLPVIVGVICVALLVVGAAGIGTARALSADGFAVMKGDEASVASVGEETQPDEPLSAAQVCVFVSGEVVHPDIYYLDEGSRVADAVTAAGGFTAEAVADALNLARTLVDGEQVAVPSQQGTEAALSAAPPSRGFAGSAMSAGSAQTSAGRVNINTADAVTLQTLNGVGEATAKKIVADREANGPYKTIEDLKRVSGIGDKKFEALRDSICV